MVRIEQKSLRDLKEKKINSWPIWEKEISCFEWYYEATEECLILEGEFEVVTAEETFKIKAGDFVTFSKGLQCTWNVIKPVRKHYNFL